MSKIETLHKTLLSEWAKPNRDLGIIERQLAEIENELCNLDALNKLSLASVNLIHKDFYEISVLYNVLLKDLEGFEESMAKVHCFYENLETESTNKYLMYGLHLLYFLATNKISQFHMLLEQIDQPIQTNNPYINNPVKWEQFLMEGAYNKVLLDEKNIPSPYYGVFVNILSNTIRNEVASCVEKSYKRLKTKDASKFLFFDNIDEVIEFANQRGWQHNGSDFVFEQADTENITAPLDTIRIAKQNLFYAKQLEMII